MDRINANAHTHGRRGSKIEVVINAAEDSLVTDIGERAVL